MGTMVATFLRYIVVTHWLLHTPLQIYLKFIFGGLESLILSFLLSFFFFDTSGKLYYHYK